MNSLTFKRVALIISVSFISSAIGLYGRRIFCYYFLAPHKAETSIEDFLLANGWHDAEKEPLYITLEGDSYTVHDASNPAGKRYDLPNLK